VHSSQINNSFERRTQQTQQKFFQLKFSPQFEMIFPKFIIKTFVPKLIVSYDKIVRLKLQCLFCFHRNAVGVFPVHFLQAKKPLMQRNEDVTFMHMRLAQENIKHIHANDYRVYASWRLCG
jgi:hypothetical protein